MKQIIKTGNKFIISIHVQGKETKIEIKIKKKL